MEGMENKIVLVVGGGSGIGRAAAVAFARHGARVVVAGRRAREHEETVALARDTGSDAQYIRADVTQPADVDHLMSEIVEHHGRLDAAFNVAGVFGHAVPLADESEEDWDRVLDTNLRGTWLCMRAQLRAMVPRKNGVIVNCSSLSGVRGHAGSAAYTASKHGIVGLTKSAALQYARKGIRVNVVCPASTDTEMLRSVYNTPESLAARANMLPMGRFAQPIEVANAAVWLCSDASSFVTGQAIVVDGGATAGRGAEKTA
jgi:NAD(P)-dependent dehydrogenase (short-subunit alcohol dehydrogenase family)